jgi:hypothetical protein
MKPKIAIPMGVVACTIGLLLGAPAAPGQTPTAGPTPTPTPTPTRAASSTSVAIAREHRVVRANGSVSPGHSGIAMNVSLLKRRGENYRKIDTKHPRLTDNSTYAVKFQRAKKGICAVRARFPGDSDHKPSSSTSIGFEC